MYMCIYIYVYMGCTYLANMIEPSVCGGDALFLSNSFTQLFAITFEWWFLVGIKLLLQGSVRAFWDEQRAYTKGTAGKLSHRNAEVCLDEMVNIASKSKRTNATHINVDFVSRTRTNIMLSTYVDAAYYYRPSSVVCRSVCRIVSPTKTAEPIEMGCRLSCGLG